MTNLCDIKCIVQWQKVSLRDHHDLFMWERKMRMRNKKIVRIWVKRGNSAPRMIIVKNPAFIFVFIESTVSHPGKSHWKYIFYDCCFLPYLCTHNSNRTKDINIKIIKKNLHNLKYISLKKIKVIINVFTSNLLYPHTIYRQISRDEEKSELIKVL